MAWETVPGTGDLLMSSADTMVTGTVSAQNVAAGVGSITTLNANTASLGNSYIDGTLIQNRTQAAAASGWFSIYRSGAEKGRIGLNADDQPTIMQGAANTPHTAFPSDGEILLYTAATIPASGDFTGAGALYVQSKALHFMSETGQVTVVASSA